MKRVALYADFTDRFVNYRRLNQFPMMVVTDITKYEGRTDPDGFEENLKTHSELAKYPRGGGVMKGPHNCVTKPPHNGYVAMLQTGHHYHLDFVDQIGVSRSTVLTLQATDMSPDDRIVVRWHVDGFDRRALSYNTTHQGDTGGPLASVLDSKSFLHSWRVTRFLGWNGDEIKSWKVPDYAARYQPAGYNDNRDKSRDDAVDACALGVRCWEPNLSGVRTAVGSAPDDSISYHH